MLRVDHLCAGYGRLAVLHDVCLEVGRGEWVALLGPNGAGKSTLVHAVMGLVASRGELCLDGHSLSRLPVEQRVEMGLALVPERRQLFDALSVEDNLLLGAYARKEAPSRLRRELEFVYELFPALPQRARDPVRRLSGGMQQMVAIGRGLMAKPRVLLLDEPLLGLAPMVVQEILRVLGQLRTQGLGILLVEQNAGPVLQAADRAYVLQGGHVVLEGTAQALLRHPQLSAAYLGAAH